MDLMEQTRDLPSDHGELIDLRKTLNVYSDRYLPYLADIIQVGSTDAEWVNTARDYPELLNFFCPKPSRYDYYGTTDVAVVQRSAVRANQPEKGLLVLFDIDRDMGEDHRAAAITRLLVANFESPETRPIVMKTDLQKQWHIFWMNGNTVRTQPLKNNRHAVYILQLALGLRQATDAEGDQAFANRQRLPDKHIPQPRKVKCGVTLGGRRLHVEDI